MAAHLPALANQLALDDRFILANPTIQSLRTLPQALASPWWYETTGLYRPLTLASFAIDRAIAGNRLLFSHGVNVVLHGIIALLLARVLARFLPWRAALVGAVLFAVIPGHAEAVASVVGRAELLSALSLVALMLLVTGVAAPTRGARIAACVLGALALASKEGGVVAPLLAFAAAWALPRQRPHAVRWAASTAAGTLILLVARAAVLGTLGGDMPNPAFRILTAPERVRTALSMFPQVAAMLVLPVQPAIDYVPTLEHLRHPSMGLVLLGAAILVATMIVMARHVGRPSAVGLGVWTIAATFAPTANILFPTGVVLAGRTLYAPAMGAAFIVAALATSACQWLTTRWMRWLFNVALATLVISAATITWRESAVWRSSESVLAEMQRRQPDDYRSFMLLGYIARDHGHDAEAVAQFREAARLFPGNSPMLTDAAAVALGPGVHDTSDARTWLTEAVAVNPDDPRARTRLVGVLTAQGERVRARQLLVDGLQREPNQRVWVAELRSLDSTMRGP